MSRVPFIGGNWKCNGTLESIRALSEIFSAGTYPDGVDIVIAPAMLHIQHARALLPTRIEVAAQNLYIKGPGAFTGEICAPMLQDLGLKWVILGHSERRRIIGESNELIAEKTAVALKAGLQVIFCIGETLEERETGKMNEVLFAQLEAARAVLSPEDWARVVIAYEPVWAIGTGVVATPEQAQDAHAIVRGWFAEHVSGEVAASIRIVYGGSVNLGNCEALASLVDIDGFLIGGASLKPEFVDIVGVAHRVKSAE